MSNFTPVAPLQFLYINGMLGSWASNTTLSIAAGQCRDSTNNLDINIGNYLYGTAPAPASANVATTVNTAVTGLNGLDTGTLAASTWYYLYAIADSSFHNPAGYILSTSATAPTLPGGYDSYRLIGYWLTDGSTHFIKAYETGTGTSRFKEYDAPISVLSGGTATSLTAVTLTGAVPPIDALPVYLDVSYTPATAADYVTFVPGGSTATTGPSVSSVVAAKAQLAQIKVMSKLVSSVAKVSYINSASSGATTALVAGFDYSL